MTHPTRPPRASWLSIPMTIVVLTATMLIPAASAIAVEPTDTVLEWNTNAINAIQNANGATPPGLAQVPPLAPVNLAIVHAAIYDAVNAIDGTHQPYLLNIHAPPDASQAAAAATAAHHVLVGLVPAIPAPGDRQPRRPSRRRLWARSPMARPSPTESALVMRPRPCCLPTASMTEGTAHGRSTSAPTRASGVPCRRSATMSSRGSARSARSSLKRADQIRIPAPPPLKSKRYAKELNEVKTLGAQTGSTRSPEQQALANWIVVNPFGPVNQTFRGLATSHGLSTAEQARLFAMTSLSAADSMITCWNNKDFYEFWRPQTAVQEAATDGNPRTTADPAWMSLFPTPGYPDWPSGYNCFAAGMMHAGKAFFGTNTVAFDITNANATRSYTRFTGYVDDAIEGRILTGFHFRSADELGAFIGEKTAKWVDRHEFRPVHH